MSWLSGPIELQYNVESLIYLIAEGEKGTQSKFSHWDIIQWCQKFTEHWSNTCPNHLVLSIADDVVVQWELYLASQYTLEQMQRFNQSDLLLSRELFSDWRDQLKRFMEQ